MNTQQAIALARWSALHTPERHAYLPDTVQTLAQWTPHEWVLTAIRMAATGMPAGFDLVQHLVRQRAFSEHTFGPGIRTQGVADHIRKELIEIEGAPDDLDEWVDVILLALDGAWRAGYSPEEICLGIQRKQLRNEARTWPDWRTQDPNKAIEHVRSGDDGDVVQHQLEELYGRR